MYQLTSVPVLSDIAVFLGWSLLYSVSDIKVAHSATIHTHLQRHSGGKCQMVFVK
jgi:hypothetical protein